MKSPFDSFNSGDFEFFEETDGFRDNNGRCSPGKPPEGFEVDEGTIADNDTHPQKVYMGTIQSGEYSPSVDGVHEVDPAPITGSDHIGPSLGTPSGPALNTHINEEAHIPSRPIDNLHGSTSGMDRCTLDCTSPFDFLGKSRSHPVKKQKAFTEPCQCSQRRRNSGDSSHWESFGMVTGDPILQSKEMGNVSDSDSEDFIHLSNFRNWRDFRGLNPISAGTLVAEGKFFFSLRGWY